MAITDLAHIALACHTDASVAFYEVGIRNRSAAQEDESCRLPPLSATDALNC